MTPQFPDLTDVEVEHMVGSATGLPLVKLRAQGTERGRTVVMVGQLEPAQARDIAMHLFEAAARAEYEVDFLNEAKRAGFDEATIAAVMGLIRHGEARRHTIGGGS